MRVFWWMSSDNTIETGGRRVAAAREKRRPWPIFCCRRLTSRLVLDHITTRFHAICRAAVHVRRDYFWRDCAAVSPIVLTEVLDSTRRGANDCATTETRRRQPMRLGAASHSARIARTWGVFDLRLHDVHSKLFLIRDRFGIRLDREIDLGHGFDGGMSTFIALSLFSNSMRWRTEMRNTRDQGAKCEDQKTQDQIPILHFPVVTLCSSPSNPAFSSPAYPVNLCFPISANRV